MLDKKITHSIYLIKTDFADDEKYLQNTADCEHHKLPISGFPDANVYLKTVTSKTHDWSRLLPTINWNQFRTSSLFGVLLIQVDGRLFALTSGLGRYLLHPFSVENRFGFKVVLNSIDPQTIQQLSKKTLSQNPKTSLEQMSKGVNISQFGVDGFTDLIQRVKGKSKLENLGLSLDGEDSLKLSVAFELNELPNLLKKCLKVFRSDEYKKHFPEIDNLSQVKDKEQISFLNVLLETQLNKDLEKLSTSEELSGDIWASIPEIVLDSDFESFTHKQAENALQYYDIELKDILTERYLKKDKTKLKDISLSSLRAAEIFIRKANGITYAKWRAINCINAVIEHEHEKFFFIENEWYRVSTSYIDSLDQKIRMIPRSNLVLKDWPHQQSEKDYLESRPLTHDVDYLILDRNNITISGQSAIEPCDIYTEDKLLIHVKRYGSSSLLGHLFNQGFVSGDLLINSVEFKEQFNKKLGNDYKIDDFTPTNFTIAYLIGSKYDGEVRLPLFSKITLTKTYDELVKKGYNVTLDFCKMTFF